MAGRIRRSPEGFLGADGVKTVISEGASTPPTTSFVVDVAEATEMMDARALKMAHYDRTLMRKGRDAEGKARK